MIRSVCFAIALVVSVGLANSIGHADTITTTFASNTGQAGNMFNVNVLAAGGIEVQQFDLNLDAGAWNIELYTKSGTYNGSETTPGDWTLHETITGLTGNGEGVATTWDFTNMVLASGAHAFYVSVTNGTALNYTNGTTEGAIAAADANIEILEGTGNQPNFGGQFRPRIWNGSIVYEVVAIPEPRSAAAIGMLLAVVSMSRRWSQRQLIVR